MCTILITIGGGFVGELGAVFKTIIS